MIIFTEHARKRMRERDILRVDAIAAVKEPDSVYDEEGGTRLYRKKLTNHTLEVVTEFRGKRIIIVTLYWI